MAAASLVALPAVAPADASAAKFGARTLKLGMHGPDVKVAQKLLRQTGSRITADGAFGRVTQQAVRSFELAAGLDGDGRIQRSEASKLRTTARAAVAQRRSLQTQGVSDPGTDPSGAQTGGDPYGDAGGVSPVAPAPAETPGSVAVVNPDGTATAPADAPDVVKQIIAAGNEIASKPYVYGGGHGKWKDRGYDCSGSVSYALHGAGLLDQSMPSGGFESWGLSGKGTWVTIYANGGHMYMVVAGIRFDTSGANPSRWQSDMRSAKGYTVRHPTGL